MSLDEHAPVANDDSTDDAAERRRDAEWRQIREALRGLRFGSVTIVVQDSVVVQIDRTEKRRLVRAKTSH